MGYDPQSRSFIAPEPAIKAGLKRNGRWKPTERMTFIAACKPAIVEGHRHGRCFMKHGWERIIALFNSSSGHNWTKQQLRNHWDAMRREWKRLFDFMSIGIEYDPSTRRVVVTRGVVVSEEWWAIKFWENKDFKDFKDKDVSKIYIRYHQLFGESYNDDKYAMTPMKLCRTGFNLFEDGAAEDHLDAIPIDGESSSFSDEGDIRTVDQATSATEKVAVKINSIINLTSNARADCVEELLARGRLQRHTPLYFYTCTLLAQKHYRDMLVVMKDADENFEWIKWQFNERGNLAVPTNAAMEDLNFDCATFDLRRRGRARGGVLRMSCRRRGSVDHLLRRRRDRCVEVLSHIA
ncbi:L10-interacting MYB domain-containing protein-like [Olea europaea var. sylvestris]|uniref:L10-interacting MYB domain-containing protein-like n=1 Tax=Olea europaea var. sylvestris TaxID=158386 RepID=UPI000C1D5B02|nr:L10-interacting MYB domain-containing protein-like [Olea europaea var. sylvestris]